MIDHFDYKLNELSILPFLFRVVENARLPLSGMAGNIVRYLKEHPGISLTEMGKIIPALEAMGEEGYRQARATVVGMVKAKIVEVCGEVPLEEVDGRYERIERCDLCGAASSTHPVVLWKFETPVVKCTSCGLLYANPRWKSEFLFGRYTPDYWQLYAEKAAGKLDNVADDQKQTRFYLWTLEPAYSNGSLLDVGCATGDFLRATKSKGWQVHGVETSPIGAKIAREVTGGDIHIGDLETAPWEDGYFDVVTMFDVVEHLQSPHRYIEKIARLLRPGGFIALNTPNIHSVAYGLLGKRWDVIGPNDHLYYFEPRTLQRLLNECGFDIHFIHSEATGWQTWAEILRYRIFRPLAYQLAGWTSPFITKQLLGDSFYMVARLRGK